MKKMVNGEIIDMTAEEVAEFEAAVEASNVVSREQIDAERDRRIANGFAFGGHVFQSGPEDKMRISGAGALAIAAIMAGAQVGNYRWHGGASDFAWIDANNGLLVMDAQTVLAFGQAAANHESNHVFAGRSLKEMDPIPADYADNKYWP